MRRAPEHGISVVVVDDDVDHAEMLAEFVASFGHRVRVARRGAAVTELLDVEDAQLVFLDVNLPDISGYDVARMIRARCGRQCRIVALTGFGGDEERTTAERAGCDIFLLKPCDFSAIRSLLDSP